MAILKAINKSPKNKAGLRNLIEYVLNEEKTKELTIVSGPYEHDSINYDLVYNSFLDTKKEFDKMNGRQAIHLVLSFHKDDAVTPEQVLEMARQFSDELYPDNQTVIAIHQDKDHIHAHIVVNSVNYMDGHKLQMSKKDLQKQKDLVNEMCKERGLHVAEKGKHFDGTEIEQGNITAWDKNKYQVMLQDGVKTKSYVMDCAVAAMEAKDKAKSKEEFIDLMQERGWQTTWSDKRKYITFENKEGNKVRDRNIEKTFNIPLNKEVLLNEFERKTKYRDLERYYAELEDIGTGPDRETTEPDKERTGATQERKTEMAIEKSRTVIEKQSADISLRKERKNAAESTRRNSEAERKSREAEQERLRVEREQETAGREPEQQRGSNKGKGIGR